MGVAHRDCAELHRAPRGIQLVPAIMRFYTDWNHFCCKGGLTHVCFKLVVGAALHTDRPHRAFQYRWSSTDLPVHDKVECDAAGAVTTLACRTTVGIANFVTHGTACLPRRVQHQDLVTAYAEAAIGQFAGQLGIQVY